MARKKYHIYLHLKLHLHSTIEQTTINQGGEDPEIVDIINRYFDFSFVGHSKLLFLNCDREVEREMINNMAILEMILFWTRRCRLFQLR